MNRLEALIALALGTVLVAGCNPNRDAADSAADQTTAPAATPSDVPPAPATTDPYATPPSTTDPMAPPTSADPTATPPPPTSPDEVPPPSN